MIELTLERASAEFGVDRRTLTRRLEAAKLPTGRGATYSLKQVHDALIGRGGDVKAALEVEKLAKLTAERALKEAELAALHRQLLPADDVARTWDAVIVAARQAIWHCDAPEADRRRWLGELRDLKVEDYFAKEESEPAE